jgi:hypothetical protein
MSEPTPNQAATGVPSDDSSAPVREWRQPRLTPLGDAADLTRAGTTSGAPDGELPFSS